MAQSPPSPELVEAYNLIKAGQKQDAGRILKGYLAQHKDDSQAWWLMSHAATQPETIRRCLEMVLKLSPDHVKARAMLDQMQAETSAPAAPPPAAEQPPQAPEKPAETPTVRQPPAAPVTAPASSAADDDDFPDDALVLDGIGTAAPAAPAPPPPQEPPASPPAAGGSFEDYLTSAPDTDPPTGPPVDDPFAPTSPPSTASEDLFAPSNAAASGSYNPFDTSNAFDPAAHAKLGAVDTGTAQAAGTGNQPEWGPGLAFVPDSDEPISLDDDDDFDLGRAKSRVERMLGIALVVFALLVLGGLILWYLDSSGWISLRGDSVPSLTRMNGGSFTIKYPKNWDKRCETDVSGYPVCGIANHPYYNDVDLFAHQSVDLGRMIAGGFGGLLGGNDVPDEGFSIIAMDVPRTSPSYDNGSWAKTSYEWSQSSYAWNPGAKINYDQKDITVDGHPGYYYEYTSEGSYKQAAWDVYVEHDGIVLWVRVDYFGPRDKKIPHNTVQAILDSIRIRPLDEWTAAE
jgi:hypothetical protein